MDIEQSLFYDLDSADTLFLPIIGDISRTWYKDKWLLAELLEVLWDRYDEVIPTFGGQGGFDFVMEELSTMMGMEIESFSPDNPRERLVHERPVEILDGAAVLLVFTRRGETEHVVEVDPAVVEQATERNINIYAVHEDGIMWRWH